MIKILSNDKKRGFSLIKDKCIYSDYLPTSHFPFALVEGSISYKIELLNGNRFEVSHDELTHIFGLINTTLCQDNDSKLFDYIYNMRNTSGA